MTKRTKQEADPFLRVALPYILSIVMGFTLVLLGFIFLSLAGLASLSDQTVTPAWVWFVLAIASEVIGVYLMYQVLSDSPAPGSVDPRGSMSSEQPPTKSAEEINQGVDDVFGKK